MAHYIVMGAGKMGLVLAKDLIESDPECQVTLVDIDFERLGQATKFIGSDRVFPMQRDIEDESQRMEVIEGKDVALCALLHKQSLISLDAAVAKGVHYIDLVGEAPLERMKYDSRAKEKGIAVISGLGVSPGITNVCVGRAVHLLDNAEEGIVGVGGVPVEPNPPLNYRVVYAVESLFGLYERDVLILKDGRIERVDPLTELERVEFAEPFSEMEWFYTDGLNSMTYTLQGKIKDLAEKTIRHMGHVAGVKILKECGFFSRDPVDVEGQKVVPRRVLEKVLDERMKLGDEKDATLLRIKVSGKKEGKPVTHVFEMIDFFDSEKHYTSMAKTTSFPASIAAQMIMSGQITQRGVLFPENVFNGDLHVPFMDGLAARGVIISQKVIQ
ncbi:MAG: saccharopine dehydrogenase NADP-binding domain-containing protein [Candidatus Aminicenantes bacterium]|nr:MAG: saccharopine dehydrogenase NADP-binding domain-containing protein [Candidatus Aminicenantes bacterium]